ncbi:MAG: hypothetical protein IKX00_02530 [Bacilli bacterium]|nr:hypothetical protein [Bacilli bacterium]
MKKIKYLLFLSLFLFPVKAIASTIETSFDNEKCELTISGKLTESESHDAVVTIFNKNGDTLGVKTSELNNENYSVTYVLTYDSEKNIDVTIANQEGKGNYSKEDVTVPACELANVLPNGKVKFINDFDGNGHMIVIKDESVGFNHDDRLDVEFINMEQMDALLESVKGTPQYEGFVAVRDSVLSLIGDYKEFLYFSNIYVRDSHGTDIDYSNYNKGFILKLKVTKEEYAQLKGIKAIMFDQENLKQIGDEITPTYDSENELLSFNIPKPGQMILYISNDYEFINNTANPTFKLGSDKEATLEIDADYSKYKELYIDGKKVDKSNYTSKAGSTIITLSNEFLNSLSSGSHEVVAYFANGSAKTTLTVEAKDESVISKLVNPKTNDPIYIFARIAIISFVGLSFMIIKKKLKKN